MDLADRDPCELNSHVKVEFDEVLAEPAGVHSYDCCWEHCTYPCFNCSKSCLYKFLTTLLSCLIAPVCGWAFALITFLMVWMVAPMFRGFSIVMGCCQMFVGTTVMCLCAPVCDAVALIFSRIQVGMESIQVKFDEVLAEPAGVHSYDCCWEHCTYPCFNCSKSCLYKFLTTLLSCLIAPVCGWVFALITFLMVWMVAPMFRGFSIVMGCCQMFVGTTVMCLCAPVCDAVALIFSRIQVGMESIQV